MVLNKLNLFISVLLDTSFAASLQLFFTGDEWFRGILFSQENKLIFIHHPELNMYLNIFANEINLHYNNALTFKLLDSYLTESFVNSILLLPEFYLLAYIFVFFLLFFFNFYSSQNNEQLIDCDFLNASLLVESEKEISSLDDFIFLVVLGLYFFGWYFFVHAFVYFNQVPEMFLLIMIIPIFLIFIFLTPAMLAYDFGIYFLCFFRGVGASSILLVEMMFDYIAFLSFYIRLIVQGIRLLLILLVYISFHDFILFVDVNDNVLIGNENL